MKVKSCEPRGGGGGIMGCDGAVGFSRCVMG